MPELWEVLAQDYNTQKPLSKREQNIARFTEAKGRRGRNVRRKVPMQNPESGPLASAYEAAQDIAGKLHTPVAYMTPGVGDYMAHQDAVQKYGWAKDDLGKGNYLSAAMHGAGGLVDDLTTVPVIGDAAMLAKGLSAGFGKMLPVMAGTFAGRNARTANREMLKIAEEADKSGLPMDRIRDATGWEKRHGKWQFEIDDGRSRTTRRPADFNDEVAGKEYPVYTGRVPGVLSHDELIKAYPEIAETTVRLQTGHPSSSGTFREGIGRLPAQVEGRTPPVYSEDARKLLLHEVGGHNVEPFEGFPRGGSPEEFYKSAQEDIGDINTLLSQYAKELDDARKLRGPYKEMSAGERNSQIRELENQYWKLLDDRSKAVKAGGTPENAVDSYRKLAGEVQARNIETRMNLTADDRAMLPPRLTEDVPVDQQIVRYGTGTAMSADLPMDEASRMARAREMGFDEDVYHYSRKNDDIKEFTRSQYDLSPFSIGPHVGSKEAAYDRFNMTSGGVSGRLQGETYPLKIKKGKQLLSNGSPWNEQELSSYLRSLQVNEFGEDFSNYREANDWLAERIWKKYDSIPYFNDVEGKGSISYIVKPRNIRSRFAKFDHAKADSADILAGAAGVGLTGALLSEMYRQHQKDNKQPY